MTVPVYTVPGSAPLFTVTAHLGGGDLSTLHSVPVTLVAAPGAAVAVVPVSIDLEYQDGGTGFTLGSDTLNLFWGSVSGPNDGLAAGILRSVFGTATTHKMVSTHISAPAGNTSAVANTALILAVAGADPTADGNLYVTLTYRLVGLH